MIPEVILVGDVELLFLGLAIGVGMPKAARKIVESRYGVVSGGNEGEERESETELCSDCPAPEACKAGGCVRGDK